VVIPCLNEEDSIGAVVDAARQGIAKLGLQAEVIVVDNGCTDRSVEIALAHGARVVAEPVRGYGAALRRGFAEASHEVVAMGDGDLTYDFTRVGDLVSPILDGEADLVMGNRMNNIRPGAMPRLHRYVGNPLLSLVLRIMFNNYRVRDAHCGMRAISKRAYERLHCATTGMEFASEMVVRAIHHKLRIQERDIVYHARVGDSKLQTFKDGWRHLRFLLLHGPTAMLLIPGVLMWLLGILISLPLAFGPVALGGRSFDIHMMMMGGLLNIASVQAITIGLLAKAYAHVTHMRHDPIVAWFYRWISFEKFLLLSLPLVATGLFVTGRIILGWIASGYSDLDQSRMLFFAVLCLVNGIQLVAAGYLFSILALPTHLVPNPTRAEPVAGDAAGNGRALA